MAGFIGFGRKPRQFEYKPRYWDPEAEERKTRRRMILGDDYAEGEYRPGMYIRERRLLRMQEQERERAQRQKRNSIRTVLFLAGAVAVLYLMFNYLGRAM
ncbi:hypothetical protein [uncultured Rikenella sp.]|uniref:hypothetical protein n=1 Tax=uncultured Rikenella sp. TaxID=368003 RepID=UPI0025D0946D|nr:hypothetical protein [uncultured Rikenella sp.]